MHIVEKGHRLTTIELEAKVRLLKTLKMICRDVSMVPKMVTEWSHIKSMYMNDGKAQIQFDPWSSTGGSKGTLQQAWFRVSKIPDDQRAIVTLAKVGGLVGKVMEIDETTRYRVDYVRLKIACRDVSKGNCNAVSVQLGLRSMNCQYLADCIIK
jgi:hypothetical protein